MNFDSSGDRVGAFDLVNILANGSITVVGIVFNGVPTMYNDTAGASLIRWPGGMSAVPSDGADVVDVVPEEDSLMLVIALSLGAFVLLCMYCCV